MGSRAVGALRDPGRMGWRKDSAYWTCPALSPETQEEVPAFGPGSQPGPSQPTFPRPFLRNPVSPGGPAGTLPCSPSGTATETALGVGVPQFSSELREPATCGNSQMLLGAKPSRATAGANPRSPTRVATKQAAPLPLDQYLFRESSRGETANLFPVTGARREEAASKGARRHRETLKCWQAGHRVLSMSGIIC